MHLLSLLQWCTKQWSYSGDHLYNNFLEVIFLLHVSQMLIIFVRCWELFQHALSEIQIDTPWRQSHIANIFINILNCFLSSTVYLLPNYFGSLLACIITDLNNTGQTLYLFKLMRSVLLLLTFWLLMPVLVCLFECQLGR